MALHRAIAIQQSCEFGEIHLSPLVCCGTVSTMKIATKLNKAMEEVGGDKLNIYIQINTSGEDTKSGLPPNKPEVLEFVKEIQETCPRLNILGLMTIGYAGSLKDFEVLREMRDYLKEQGLSIEELSMGMSNDFE